MTFDKQIALWCVAVPILIVAVSCLATQFMRSRWPASRWGNVMVAAGWWIAVTVALTVRQGWQWWPEEAWRQAVWSLLAWALLVSGVASDQLDRPWTWVVAGVLASVTALVAMPGGDQWSDIYQLHRVWMCAVGTSCLINSFAISCMVKRQAERWVLLVALTAPVGSLLLAGGAYGSLAEWTLAIIVATISVALWSMFSASLNGWVVAFPVLVAAASVTAAARFYTYDEIPQWVYGVVLFGPTLIAVVDSTICGRPTWLRITVSCSVSLSLLSSCVWAVLLN